MNYLNTDLKNIYFLDIETNGLDPDKIWCCVIKTWDSPEGSCWTFTHQETIYDDIKKFIQDRPEASWCGHNITSFDGYHIGRLCGFDFPFYNVIDTLILSYLYNPKLEGHSLEDYGRRLRFPKGDFSDWSKFSEEMLTYCIRDVDLTERVYTALVSKMLKIGYSNLSCWIEHNIRLIINEQERYGFYFNRVGAESLRDDLRKRQSGLTQQIQTLFPPEHKEVGRYTRRKRKDGGDYASYTRHLQTYRIEHHDDGTYSTLQLEEFNIASPQQRLERLLRLGYKPTAKTKKGNPKIDEDSLLAYAKLSGRPEIGAMAEWLVLEGRSSMIETWLNNLGDDSRIHGKIMTCGAGSRRMIHNKPNTANVPHPKKAKYGKEVRDLWCVETWLDYIEVGADAAGLENVGLLHYLHDRYRDKTAALLAQEKPNDVHSMNARRLTEALQRVIDREWGAKTSYYAALYGAYPKKLGEIVKGTKKEGETVQDIILNSVPGLKELTDRCQREWDENDGRLKTIDGGYVLCPNRSASLNYKVQSLGAIVMKLAQILLWKRAKLEGLWFKFVGTIHDEWQKVTKKEDGERLGKMACECISEAAVQLKFKLPLGGNYAIGTSWGECH